jgi:hypothetical protein
MNGILNAITLIQRWQSGGGHFQYDATWSSDNGGYPKGAMLVKASGSGYWVCTADNNTTNPDGGSPANWVDLGQVLSAVVTAAQFNNSTAPASTAFVQTALGNKAGASGSSGAGTYVISASQAGLQLYFSGGVTTVTLPLISSVPAGSTFYIQAAVALTVNRSGSDTIFASAAGQTSIPMPANSTLIVTANSFGWSVEGSARLQYDGLFLSSFGTSSWDKSPNGRILQFGKTGTISANSQAVLTFPFTFPTAARAVILTKENSDVTNEQTFDAAGLSTTGVTITNTSGVAGACWWMAVGN